MTLPSRILGRTGAEVSVLGYGAMELRGAEYMGGPAVSDADAGRLLNELLDAGVTLIDTSIDYGHSEELIGKHLGARRGEYFLASKCGCAPALPPGVMPMPDTHDFGPANVRAGVEQSLTRLRTDHLDLVQVHLSPSRDELETGRTLDTLAALRAEGKVRFLGMSGTLPHLPDHIAMDVFDEFQIPYSALQPEHDALISDAARSGAGVIVRGGTARGAAAADKNFTVQPLSMNPSGPTALDRWQAARLDELLDGMSRHEFVLRFTISHPDVASTIVGTANLEHLRANVGIVARGPLPADVYTEARKRLGLDT
ncbi:aldo/keto reductase [Nocardia sp. alder85J]|uniref:aldo/keto reductase n=1 Tax=Nocardia sp. alder85J TaxID=2862949 RepID=UPI001CD53010|nr:aldo/keto reductase [Nocardia sp. alder85J]MCX4091832.1 aldo/keto reductase [Nocardia sp. alder85J]